MSSSVHEPYRDDLSAYIDGELDPGARGELEQHLETCAECRAVEKRLRGVVAAVRLQTVEAVPNLTEAIMERITEEQPLILKRQERVRRFRIGAAAAVVTAAVLVGSSLPWLQDGSVASAADVTGSVRAAARALESYRAEYRIVERGWHEAVPVRRFDVRVSFNAPETMSLSIEDRSNYPSAVWPRNDVRLLADPNGWWIKEPRPCPVAALPICVDTLEIERGVTDRQPFDGGSRLPTDLILPLETLAGSENFRVVGERVIAGHAAYELEMEFRDAQPFVAAVEAGGSWRTFEPTDRVEMFIDRATWFPLLVRVTPAGAEQPDLVVRAVSLNDTDEGEGDIDVPATGTLRDGGWTPEDPESLDVPAPGFLSGLEPYRSGSTSTGREVLSYARGLTWLKVAAEPAGRNSYPRTAESVRLSNGSPAYYLPADWYLSRRVDLFTSSQHIVLESNLSREDLIEVAASISVVARRAPDPPGVDVVSVDEAFALEFAREPSYLPEGYRPSSAYVFPDGSGTASEVTYRRSEIEFDGLGIRLVQSDAVEFLPPSSQEFQSVVLDGVRARWSPDAGELQWISRGVYRSITAPSLDLGTVLAIANGLR